MAKSCFTVTYEIVTPESAEYGEAEESGFVLPGGWHVDATDPSDVTMDLRSAAALVSTLEDSGRWFTETDGHLDYRTGVLERRALHPPRNITPASYKRLSRLLGCR
jgi:hypothetical protein